MSTDRAIDLVSVISPAYNAEKTIDATIQSVLGQTHPHWELLVGDDCSSDETATRVRAYGGDPRIKLLVNERNIGPARTRNQLIRSASGRFIAFLDADDEWLPTKLEEQLALMSETNSAICCSAYVRRFSGRSTEVFPPSVIAYEDLLKSNYVPMLTAVIDRERCGDVQFEVKGHEDYQLWLNLTRSRRTIRSVQKVLAVYNAGSTESVSGNKLRAAQWHWRIMSKEPIPFYRKTINFLHYAVNGIRKNA